jgi:hypothetical protein
MVSVRGSSIGPDYVDILPVSSVVARRDSAVLVLRFSARNSKRIVSRSSDTLIVEFDSDRNTLIGTDVRRDEKDNILSR